MSGISLKFDDLTIEEARAILSALEVQRHMLPVADAGTTFRHPHENHWAGTSTHLGEPAPTASEVIHPVHYTENAPIASNTSAAAEGFETDAAGLPWVDGTHSSSRKKNADGSWSLRKGCPEALGATYKAEYRRRMAGSTAAAPRPAAQLNQQYGAPPVHQLPTPAAAFAAPEIDYQTWANQYMAVLPKLDEQLLADILARAGVGHVNDLANPAAGTARQATYSMFKQLELA